MLTPLFLSQQKELLLAGGFPFGTEQCWLREWDDAGKSKLFFLHFLCDYSEIFLFQYVAEIS